MRRHQAKECNERENPKNCEMEKVLQIGFNSLKRKGLNKCRPVRKKRRN